MKKNLVFLLAFLFLISCGQDYNSNTNDRGTYADTGISAGDPFYQPYQVLQTKCFSCHGSEWSDFKISQQWVDAGLVVPGNYATSLIKTRLKNYGGNMPPEPFSPLTTTEINIISTWINSL
jgi:uncharacterized membrane protein